MHIANIHFYSAHICGLYCLLLVRDRKTTVCAVLTETVVGPGITQQERAQLLAAVGFSPHHIHVLQALMFEGGWELTDKGLAPELLRALAQWHKFTSYTHAYR